MAGASGASPGPWGQVLGALPSMALPAVRIDYGGAAELVREVFALVKSDAAALRDVVRRVVGAPVSLCWDALLRLAELLAELPLALAGLPCLLRDVGLRLRVLVADGMPRLAAGCALLPSPPPAPPASVPPPLLHVPGPPA